MSAGYLRRTSCRAAAWTGPVLWSAIVAGYALLAAPAVLRADPPGRDVPGEVAARALVAQRNLQSIRQALFMYINDRGEPPSSPALLYPTYVSDPLVFWHPGDDTPPPTTITNDTPNGLNSTQGSFRIDLAAFVAGEFGGVCNRSLVLIEDWSAGNNAGLFRNLLTTGGIETAPYGVLPGPAAAVMAGANLRALCFGAWVYSNDNNERFPQTIDHYVDACIALPNDYWHPGDDLPVPRWITNTALDAPESAQISFAYLGGGLTMDTAADHLVFIDNSPANNEGFGRLGVWGDARVEYFPLCEGDATGDLLVDVADLLRVSQNLGRWGNARPSEGDLNLDGRTDLVDVAIVQRSAGNVGGP
jgi:hypothetical protein